MSDVILHYNPARY